MQAKGHGRQIEKTLNEGNLFLISKQEVDLEATGTLWNPCWKAAVPIGTLTHSSYAASSKTAATP